MEYIIGMDEAGYGPNLGPLVIGATVWEVPAGLRSEQLYTHLTHLIASPADLRGRCDTRLTVGDSKALYSSGKGLEHLERGVWAGLGLLGAEARSFGQLWEFLDTNVSAIWQTSPWREVSDQPLGPTPHDGFCSLVEQLRGVMAAAGVRLAAMRCRSMFPQEFNDLLERHGSKGTLLTRETLSLAAAIIDSLPFAPTTLICDKHGGRNRYLEMVVEHFPGCYVEVLEETRRRSRYHIRTAHRQMEVTFQMHGESCLPVAWASMLAKYMRELAMRFFNDFWRRHVPELRPTAGYPNDAQRFWAETAEARRKLGIPDRTLWRNR